MVWATFGALFQFKKLRKAMHRTGKILFLCLFFVGADFQTGFSAVSDKNKHESIIKFTSFWQELELFVYDLKASMQHYCPDRRVTQKCLTDHFNSLAGLGTRSKKTDDLTDLLAIMDQAIYDLGQIETFLRNLALFFKMEAAKGFSDEQMQLNFADAQAQIYLEPICKKLDLLLKKAAVVRETLRVAKIYVDDTGRGWIACASIGFSSKQACENFRPIANKSITVPDAIEASQNFFPFNIDVLADISMENKKALGIVDYKSSVRGFRFPRFAKKQEKINYEYQFEEYPKSAKCFVFTSQKSVAPKKTFRPDFKIIKDQPSNLTCKCESFGSQSWIDGGPETQIILQGGGRDAAGTFGELDGIFSSPNAEERFLPHNGVIKPKTLDRASQDLIDGSQVCFSSIKSGDCPDSEGGQPSNSSENNGGPNKSGYDSDNSKNSQDSDEEIEKKKKKEPFSDENFFVKTKAEMIDNLHKQGLFSSLSPESNKNLCSFGGHLYALGAQDMAEHIKDYIEEKDAFFKGLQLDNVSMHTIFQDMSKPIAPQDKAEIARHYAAVGQVLPGDLNASAKEVNAICQMRIAQAVEDFQRGMPLPKDFLRQLTQLEWQKLIDHSINTLGLAVQTNTYLMSMHEFTHAATRAGYKMGYLDCIKNKEPMAPQLQSMLDQEREKNEILEEKLAQVSAEKSKTTEMLSKTTAYLENVRQAHNTRSKEFEAKNIQIDELKNKVQSLENEKSTWASEKATLEKEKESISQTSKKQMAAIFSSFKNKLDESKPKPETSEPEKTEPKSSTPSQKPTIQNISNLGVIDDEKEQMRLRIQELEAENQELKESQSARPKMYFKDSGKFKKVSDDSSKNTDYERGLKDGYGKGFDAGTSNERKLVLDAKAKQLLAEKNLLKEKTKVSNDKNTDLKEENNILKKEKNLLVQEKNLLAKNLKKSESELNNFTGRVDCEEEKSNDEI